MSLISFMLFSHNIRIRDKKYKVKLVTSMRYTALKYTIAQKKIVD